MSHKYLEQMDVWGPTLSDMMSGCMEAEREGWFRIGTPSPMYLPGQSEFGMMQKMFRHRSKE